MTAVHRPSGRHVRNCALASDTLHAGLELCITLELPSRDSISFEAAEITSS